MALQLTEFAAEIRRDIDAFEAAYRAKAEASPEIYPLTLPAGQEVWFEFFLDYRQTGNV